MKIHCSPSQNEDAAPVGPSGTLALSLFQDEAKLVPTVPLIQDEAKLVLTAVLFLAILLLLAACADANNAKREDPVIFGNASGANGGAGASTGVSLSW